MPKFIYTFIAIFLAASLALTRTVFWTSPENPLSLFVFFFSLFLVILSFLTLALSLTILPRHRDITNQRIVFRKTFRIGLMFSLFVVALAVIKVLGALNPLNLCLLLLLMAVYGFFIYK